jgi:hypothetical protein
MKARSAAGILAGALALVAACGGKVVVDAEPAGAGGGASSASSGDGAGGSGGDAGSALTCDQACGGPIGLCGCTGTCSDGKVRGVACGETPTGATCSCSVDEEVIGTCDEPSLTCGLPSSCCQAIFGG